MPVFDFSNATTEKKDPECTYTTFRSNETKPSPEKPILVLENTSRQWNHHSCGVFSNPNQKSSFEFKEEDGVFPADILKIDARFVSLVKWLGENHISVRLSSPSGAITHSSSLKFILLRTFGRANLEKMTFFSSAV